MSFILGIPGSNSKNSNNKKLVEYIVTKISQEKETIETLVLDLNDFEMPIFNPDKNEESGTPEKAKEVKDLIIKADAIVSSLAEYNGSFTPAFKIIIDWTSVVAKSMWEDKPLFILSSSPGPRGGESVLASFNNYFPHRGGNIISSMSVPSVMKTFNSGEGFMDDAIQAEFETKFKIM